MKKRSSPKASTTNRKPTRAVNAKKKTKVTATRSKVRGRPTAGGAGGRGLPERLRKVPIALRVDADVLAWFKAQGPGYQTRINAVLRVFMDTAR